MDLDSRSCYRFRPEGDAIWGILAQGAIRDISVNHYWERESPVEIERVCVMGAEADRMNHLSKAQGWALVLGWCGVLVVAYATTTYIMSSRMAAERERAILGHQMRLDPTRSEPGKTEVETRSVDLDREAKNIAVEAGVYVDRIYNLSIRDTRWNVDFYIWYLWSGDGIEPGNSFQVVDGAILTKRLQVRTDHGAQHYELYRVTAEITKLFNVVRFPVDDHLLTLRIEDTTAQHYDLWYVPDTQGSNVSSRVQIPDYVIFNTELVEKKHSYKTRRGDARLSLDYKATHSQLIYGISIKRGGWGLYLKMFFGLFASVAVALLAFYVRPAAYVSKFQLGVGAFFAAVASTYIVTRHVPLHNAFGLTEFVTSAALATIFLTISTSVILVWIHDHLKDLALAKRLNMAAHLVFLVGYVGLNVAVARAALL